MSSSNFVKEELIGSGAFGVVYRVRSKRTNKLYVIKEQQMTSAAVNEVKVLKMMPSHPNVVGYHGSWYENGKGCILMEYASRGSLEDVMNLCAGPIPEEKALYLFAQIVLGVNHIHRQSIIHRDLKPANVMIHRQEFFGLDIIKIGDFGISKDTGRFVARTAIGTKIYMAPETFEGRSYDSRCDMWSCGIILYELLTNKFPFRPRAGDEMTALIRCGRVTPIDTDADISSCTSRMIYRLLSVNPNERPRSRQLVNLPDIAKWNRTVRDYLRGKSSATRGTSCSYKPSTIEEMMSEILQAAPPDRRRRAMENYRNGGDHMHLRVFPNFCQLVLRPSSSDDSD